MLRSRLSHNSGSAAAAASLAGAALEELDSTGDDVSPGVPVTFLEDERSTRLAHAPLLMIVEDDFVLRGALAELLRSEGYRVECCASGIDALRRLEHAPKPSLILLDMMLPYMDGVGFRTRQIASPATANIPVVVITAIGVSGRDAEQLGLRRVFMKPLDLPKLLATIQEVCRPVKA